MGKMADQNLSLAEMDENRKSMAKMRGLFSESINCSVEAHTEGWYVCPRFFFWHQV